MSKIADETLFKLIHDFLVTYLPTQRNSSPNTVRAYKTSLEMLLDYIKDYNQVPLSKVTFRMLDEKTVSCFLDYLESERGCCVSTRNHRLKCIKAFLKYAAMVEPTVVIYRAELSKIPTKKDSTTAVEYMSENAIRALLEEPDTSTRVGIRNQFIMILAYDTGARIQELVDLRLRDIRLGKTPTVVLSGKGGKVRTVPLMQATVQHLSRYLDVFHHKEKMLSDRPLFYTYRQGTIQKLSCDGIRKWLKRYGISASGKCDEIPDNVHPHLFRHSRAMHLYQNGMDLTLVSQWLGHANLDTTLIYAHANMEQKRSAIEKATSKNNPTDDTNLTHYNLDDEDVLKRLYGLK